MKRVMCVWLPDWPLRRLRHARPELRTQPLALYALVERATRIVAATPRAIDLGVRVGMSRIEAEAIALGVHFERHDPVADERALRKLALWCRRFSPLVAIEDAAQPECLLFDVTGCGPFFGGESKLAARVVRDLRGERCLGERRGLSPPETRGDRTFPARINPAARHTSLRSRVAIADTVGAAWAGARFGAANPLVMPSRDHAELLGPMPIEALRLPADMVRTLHHFDLRTVDQLRALPRSELPGRFGPLLTRRLDQALGDVREVLTFLGAEEPIEAIWSSDDPLVHRRGVELVLARLVEEILGRLRLRQHGVLRLLCTLTPDEGEPVTMPVSLLRPCDRTQHLLDLVNLHLERLRLPGAIADVTVRVMSARPIEIRQHEIYPGDDSIERAAELRVLLERMSHRLGEQAVLRPRLVADPQPELACRYEPWPGRAEGFIPSGNSRSPRVSGGDKPLRSPPRFVRPLQLRLRPVAVRVLSVFPGGPPRHVWWDAHESRIVRAWGPERIESGWWRGRDARRDYYLVETATGQRLWLFRALQGERWYLHGTYA
jgi:protein ImuB